MTSRWSSSSKCAASAGRTSTRFVARRCNMRERRRNPIRPSRSFPGHEIVGKVAEIGKTASHSLEYGGAGAQDRRPGRHVSRHSLRQVLVLPEHVRLSAVPEHQRLRQRLHLRRQPASHGRLGRLHLCPQGRLRVQDPRGHGAAHRGHVRTHDLHLQSRQGQRALHHGRGRLRLRRDDRRPGRGSRSASCMCSKPG